MSCHDARDWFSGWIDETLTVEEHAALAAHLAECADCSRELGRFRATVALLERVERPRAPAGFAARVLDAVRPVPWHRRLVARLFLPLAVKLPAEAAAALLVAGLAVYLFQSTPVLQQAAREDASPPAARQHASPQAPPRGAPSPSTAPLIAPSMQPPPTGAPSSSTTKATPPSMPPPAAAPQMPSAPGVASSMPTPPVVAPSPPTPSSRPEPPAGVGPAESLPSPATEAPSKVESKSRGETTSGALGGAALGRAKELEKSAVAPLSPPEAARTPGAVSEAKKDTATAGAPIAQAPEPRPAEAPARISPAVEDRRDSPAEKARRARAQLPAAPRAAMNALPAADVVGRLTVKDRGAAESAVVDLITRTGGTLVSRRADSDGSVMDVMVPRARYAEFSGGLRRIGAWLPQDEPAALPPDVRVTLRLAE
jgi:anti-sigma factor RsiW